MAYTGKKPTDHTDVTQSQSMTVTDDLTVDTNTLVVDSTNNRIGVGTDSPDTIAEIRGANPIVTIRDTETSSGSAEATLRLAETGASDSLGSYWDIKSSGGQLQFIDNWDEGGGTGTRVTLDDSGNVGIGTSSPSSILHLSAPNDPIITLTDTNHGGSADITGSNGNLRLNSGTATLFDIADSEIARFDSAGDFFIGRTSGNPSTSQFGTRIYSTGFTFFSRDVNGGSASLRVFGNAGEGRIMGDGDLQNTNNSYGAISDETLKQDIVDAASQWDDIKDIRVRKFRFKDNPEGALHIGVIAQELEASGMNGLVKEVMLDDDDEGTEETIKSVKYSVLYMKAIKALQEAIERIETLETKVATLETQNADFETRLTALEAN